jgi:hypothetical protein
VLTRLERCPLVRYMKGDSLCDIAGELSYPPTLLARDIVGCHLMSISSKGTPLLVVECVQRE